MEGRLESTKGRGFKSSRTQTSVKRGDGPEDLGFFPRLFATAKRLLSDPTIMANRAVSAGRGRGPGRQVLRQGKRKSAVKRVGARSRPGGAKAVPAKAAGALPKRRAGRRTRLRLLTKRMLRLSERSPSVVGDSIKVLGRHLQRGNLTRAEFTRIFLAPLKEATLISALQGLVSGKVPLERFMKRVNDSYEKRVPQEMVDALLGCKKGHFQRLLLGIELEFRPPKSFATGMAGARARALAEQGKVSKELSKEIDRLGWDIHKATHGWKSALRKGDREAEAQSLEELRKLEARQAQIIRKL